MSSDVKLRRGDVQFLDRNSDFKIRSERRGRKRQIAMTETEKRTLELLKTMSYKMVAEKEGVKVETIYKRIQRLRDRIREAQRLVNQRNAWAQHPRLKKVLYGGRLKDEPS